MTHKICFINPPNVPFSSKGILIEPIDTLSLATYIQSLGYATSMLDMDVKKLLSTDLGAIFNNDWPSIMVIVFDYHIPLHNAGANNEITQICSLAKANGCVIILGGKAATFYEEDKIKKLGADIFIQHEMENPLAHILSLQSQAPNNWLDKLDLVNNIRYFHSKHIEKPIKNELFQPLTFFQNKFVENKIELNSLPIPNRKLIDLDDYIDVRTILSSRGCNLKCTFCHVPGFWGNWKGRSVQSVVEEIELLTTHFNSPKILFLDDNAMAQPKRLASIAQALKHNNTQVTMGCLGTVASYQPSMIEQMYEGGFRWIHYGAESGDNFQLKTMGKKIEAHKTLEAVKGTQAIGLRVRTSWILDMPDLTEEGLLKTEKLILEHGADEIRLHFLTIRLGSILYDQYALDTPQFIHNSQPNLNISSISSLLIEKSVERIIQGLQSQGYILVKNPDDFIDIERLKQLNPLLKIVSLCPLRYGLGWVL